ncbi:hypothetical protein JCM8547_004892 [Rhodosporidiobolus lusitaniae]
MSRFALSRKEEEAIEKLCKAEALRACQIQVANFSTCAEGRTVSVTWACRKQFKEMQACMSPHMSEEKLDAAKVRFFREGGVPTPAGGAAISAKPASNSPYA